MGGGIMGSVVLRNMKRSPHFHRAETVSLPDLGAGLEAEEFVTGVYRNPAPWERCEVVFTDLAIHILDGVQIVKVRWSDIVDYETLDPNGNVDGVRLRTRDGIRFVRIAGVYGPDGKFKDAFNLAMVLRSLLGR